MAIHGYKGGVISATPPTTSVSGASGVWTVDDALQAGANWPVAPALSTNSVRIRASASAYMSRTPASAGNQKTWTWSGWVKRGALGVGFLFSANSTSPFFDFFFNSGDQLRAFNYNGSGYDFDLTTNAVFRDPSAWYHIVLAVDTTQATNTNRVKLYVNNVQQTFTGSSYPNQNVNTAMNSAVVHNIGREAQTAGNYFDGYITDLNLIDGQALTPNYFGATDYATGVWQPATYRGTYGTNGFYLPMNKTVEGYDVEYLLIAGGGGGADGYTYAGQGGGGGGGYANGTVTVFSGTAYTTTVGAGGNGNFNYNSASGKGNASTFNSLTAAGGGKGVWFIEDPSVYGNGACGAGGAGGSSPDWNATAGGTGSQGGNGGAGTGKSGSGGGGGGLGGNGSAAPSSSTGGDGGVGTNTFSTWATASSTGASGYYSGGGGGGGRSTGGTAVNGGGNGGGNAAGTNGSANTGGGGGGGGTSTTTGYQGGNGGSGVIIIRYAGSQRGTGGTVTSSGGYTYHTFTSSGSYTA